MTVARLRRSLLHRRASVYIDGIPECENLYICNISTNEKNGIYSKFTISIRDIEPINRFLRKPHHFDLITIPELQRLYSYRVVSRIGNDGTRLVIKLMD